MSPPGSGRLGYFFLLLRLSLGEDNVYIIKTPLTMYILIYLIKTTPGFSASIIYILYIIFMYAVSVYYTLNINSIYM